MKVYHGAPVRNAALIERMGFRDNTGRYMTESKHSGVWVANRPLDGYAAEDLAYFEIELSTGMFAEYEWVEEDADHREALIPAVILNNHPRRRLSEAELSALDTFHSEG